MGVARRSRAGIDGDRAPRDAARNQLLAKIRDAAAKACQDWQRGHAREPPPPPASLEPAPAAPRHFDISGGYAPLSASAPSDPSSRSVATPATSGESADSPETNRLRRRRGATSAARRGPGAAGATPGPRRLRADGGGLARRLRLLARKSRTPASSPRLLAGPPAFPVGPTRATLARRRAGLQRARQRSTQKQ